MALGFVAGLGLVQCLAGWAAVMRFAAAPAPAPRQLPPVTILKPLCGDEPLLADALLSCCRQDYPVFQIVFGVQDAADPALAVVRDLKEKFPERDITVIVDPTSPRPQPEGRESDQHAAFGALRRSGVSPTATCTLRRIIWCGWSRPWRSPIPASFRPCMSAGRRAAGGRNASAPPRSITAFCPARCWQGRWGGRTVLGARWRCIVGPSNAAAVSHALAGAHCRRQCPGTARGGTGARG